MNYNHDLKDSDCGTKSKNKIILNIKVLEVSLSAWKDSPSVQSSPHPYFCLTPNQQKIEMEGPLIHEDYCIRGWLL
jgi:hypothetical protein